VDTLHYLESQGFCHNDLKFENLLSTPSGQYLLIDFGLSARIGSTREKIFGTKGYIAPESYSQGDFTIGSDIYSLGKIVEKYEESRPKGYLISDAVDHLETSL
jgi:serine/threonine protein kinase